MARINDALLLHNSAKKDCHDEKITDLHIELSVDICNGGGNVMAKEQTQTAARFQRLWIPIVQAVKGLLRCCLRLMSRRLAWV